MLKSTKKLLFKGCATALVTPMKNGEADIEAFAGLVRAQIDAGVSALVVCGTTGEAPTLTERERQKLISRAVQISDGRVPVIAGTGGPCTDKMLRMSWSAKEVGADGLLIVNPYYNKGTDDGVARSYFAAAEIGLPIILYNVPSRTGVDIPVSVYRQLSAVENIAGVKEASSDISKIAKIRSVCPPYFSVWSGNDDQTVPVMALGGKGVISVVSNVLPAQTNAMVTAAQASNYAAAAALQIQLLPLIEALFSEVNPIPVKEAMNLLGFDCGGCRLPLTAMSPQKAEALKDALGALL